MHIEKYNPPFLKDSFVKLDSLVKVSLLDCAKYDIKILHNGDCLDKVELQKIIEEYSKHFLQ